MTGIFFEPISNSPSLLFDKVFSFLSFPYHLGHPNITMNVNRAYSTEELWQVIECTTNCKIPKYIQNLLKSRGFDNIIAIKNIDEDDIQYLESFAKSEEYKVPMGADLKDYLGSYHDEQKSFQILRGHKKMLLGIEQRISKENTDKKSKQQNMEINNEIKGINVYLILRIK